MKLYYDSATKLKIITNEMAKILGEFGNKKYFFGKLKEKILHKDKVLYI